MLLRHVRRLFRQFLRPDGQPSAPVRPVGLLLCPAAFLVPTQTAGLVILAPAALYVIFCCVTRRTQPDYFSVADSFFLELKLLIFPALMALALVQISRAERFSLPYLDWVRCCCCACCGMTKPPCPNPGSG